MSTIIVLKPYSIIKHGAAELKRICEENVQNRRFSKSRQSSQNMTQFQENIFDLFLCLLTLQ